MADIDMIEIWGSNLAIILDDDRRILAYPTPHNSWLPSESIEIGDVTPDPGVPGNPGGGGTPTPGEWQWPFQYSRYVIQTGSIAPLAQFGMRVNPVTGVYRLHAGLDFGGGGISGLPIPLASAGTVTAKGLDARGNFLNVTHAGGFMTAYFHMVSPSVHKVGDVLAKGTILGQVGSTGNSTGAHLHWETHVNGTAINPRDFMKARGVPET